MGDIGSGRLNIKKTKGIAKMKFHVGRENANLISSFFGQSQVWVHPKPPTQGGGN
jgi:hypothetical protein